MYVYVCIKLDIHIYIHIHSYIHILDYSIIFNSKRWSNHPEKPSPRAMPVDHPPWKERNA